MRKKESRLGRRSVLKATGVALGASVGVASAGPIPDCYYLPHDYKVYLYSEICPTHNQPKGPVIEPQELYVYETCMGGTWGNREFGYTILPEGAFWIPLDALESC